MQKISRKIYPARVNFFHSCGGTGKFWKSVESNGRKKEWTDEFQKESSALRDGFERSNIAAFVFIVISLLRQVEMQVTWYTPKPNMFFPSTCTATRKKDSWTVLDHLSDVYRLFIMTKWSTSCDIMPPSSTVYVICDLLCAHIGNRIDYRLFARGYQ